MGYFPLRKFLNYGVMCLSIQSVLNFEHLFIGKAGEFAPKRMCGLVLQLHGGGHHNLIIYHQLEPPPHPQGYVMTLQRAFPTNHRSWSEVTPMTHECQKPGSIHGFNMDVIKCVGIWMIQKWAASHNGRSHLCLKKHLKYLEVLGPHVQHVQSVFEMHLHSSREVRLLMCLKYEGS